MIPNNRQTLYTGRILHGYIIISLALLLLLAWFIAIFLVMANSLNRNARLQQENHFLSMQRERYENLKTAIEDARPGTPRHAASFQPDFRTGGKRPSGIR